MKKQFLCLIFLGILASFLYSQTITPIADIVENFNDFNQRPVTIDGIVVMGARTLHSNILRAYVQDNSGKGIQIHAPSLNAENQAAFVRGNYLRISGTVGLFDGMRQITSLTSFEVMERGYEPPFIELTIREAQNHAVWEGTYIKISGTVAQLSNPVGGGRDLIVQDGLGDRIIVRVWETTGLNISSYSIGLPLDVKGVVRIFQNSSQVTPGYREDFIIKLTDPVIENIVISPESPYVDQEITISADIIDYDGHIESIKFSYRSSLQTVWTESTMTSLGNNVYRAVLPPFNSIHENSEGEYIFRIEAVDNEDNKVSSEDRRIKINFRRPIISNIETNSPAEREDLIVWANIDDAVLNGTILSAKVFYTIDFSPNIRETEMLRNNSNPRLWESKIPGYSAGTMVNISIWAENDTGLTSIEDKDGEGNAIRYVFPLINDNIMLRIHPKAYNIYEGVGVEIGFFAKAGDIAVIRIYNSEGKLVSTPVNRITSQGDAGINFYTWDGRDNDFRLVEPGMYICHLEVRDRTSGSIKNATAPIVIGTRLRRGR
ncbi:MAG: hypothetical protein FWG98_00800 [Candidatus Cloacimonetes bacterium]|nr:hypothetical protein [Candidatus Cloacimonadota bacterium]